MSNEVLRCSPDPALFSTTSQTHTSYNLAFSHSGLTRSELSAKQSSAYPAVSTAQHRFSERPRQCRQQRISHAKHDVSIPALRRRSRWTAAAKLSVTFVHSINEGSLSEIADSRALPEHASVH